MRSVLCAALALCVAGSASGQLAEPNAAGVAFGHIHLNVADLEVHQRIWVEHFGGEWVDREPVAAVWLPGVLIMFNDRTPTGPSEGSVIDHFGFRVRDLDGFLSGWREAGFEVEGEFMGGEGARNAYVLTPDGLRVELHEDPTISSTVESHHVHWYPMGTAALQHHYVTTYAASARIRGSIETTADVPGMNLSFSEAPEPLVGGRGRVVDHVGFEVVGLERLVGKLEEQGITFDIPYRVLEGLGIGLAFYTDPSGVVIELTEGLGTYR